MAWQMQVKANAQVGLHTGLAKAMLYVKQERILSAAPELGKFPDAS
jgi:hypothetical protein